MKQWMPLALAVAALSACTTSSPNSPYYVYRPYHYEVLAGNLGWPPAAQPYCYETLGVPDCRASELPGEEHRLINDPKGVNPY